MSISGDSLHFKSRPDFWYQTTFILPTGTDPRQLHATITASSSEADIGKVVVALFKIEEEALTLGVIDDFPGPLTSPVPGDWDSAIDQFHFTRNSARTQVSFQNEEDPEKLRTGA